MANTWISRTHGSAPTSAYKYTVSLWIKRSQISSRSHFVRVINPSATTYYMYFEFQADDKLHFYDNNANGGLDRVTNNLLRDVNGWYHVMAVVDTTQATASNRVKLYINGDEPSYASTTHTNGQNTAVVGNENGKTFYIGADGSVPTRYFSGSISHFHFCDGYAYSPSDFGSTDATTGEWKINTNPNVTYGNNGFFVLKNGNSVTDQSPNTNNFTVANGTLTKTEDNPSNVFATLNALYNSGGTVTYSNGNTKFEEADNQWKTTFSTLSAASGKYYAEFKCNGNYMTVGVADMTRTFYGIADRNFASTTLISEQGYAYYNGNGDLYYRGSSTSYGNTYGSGDIIQVALDCDNNRVFFGKNGTWQNSADPTNASSGFSMTATNARYAFAVAVQQDQVHANFGNGYFSTTAVASAGTNASGNGIFEYDVPTGYTALSTKGLNL